MEIDGVAWFVSSIFLFVPTFVFWIGHVRDEQRWRREYRQLLAEERALDKAAAKRHSELMEASTWYQRSRLGWSDKRGHS